MIEVMNLTRGKGTIIGVLVMVTVFVFASMPAQAWSATGTFRKPTTMYQDSTYTFSLEVENTGTESMSVDSAFIKFDWQAEGYGYEAVDIAEVIASGSSKTFSWTVGIPDGITTNTDHAVEIDVSAADPDGSGGWGASAIFTYTYSIYITSTPDPDPVDDTTDDTSDYDDDTGGDETPGFTFPIMVSALFVGIGIMTVTRRYRKN